MSRPIQARIDLDALEHNLQVARCHAPSARVMAVIKANGYGHGLMRVAEALADADGFALLDHADAVRLRAAGYRQSILLLEGFFNAEDAVLAAEHDLSCVLHSDWQIPLLDNYPKRGGLDIWLKINTGMHRLGFQPETLAAVLEKVGRHPAMRSIILMTHFANADGEIGVASQLRCFAEATGGYRLARSLANSAALLAHPQTHGDWVRPGIMLYGSSPFADIRAEQFGLRPAMTLSSRIIAVRELRGGDEVGYGSAFRAPQAMRIGIVACGYADGYPRHAGTGTPILVDGQRTRTLGRVSMDMLCVDLSAIPQAKVGSKVVMWGEGISIDEVAKAAGTIGYELMCGVTARVPVVTGE